VIDALIGYGVRGDPTGRTADLIAWANDSGSPVISLDGPSGLDLTAGRPGDPTVRATTTVTLAMPKLGLFAEAAGPFVGRLFATDIGVLPEAWERLGLGRITPFARASILELRSSPRP
jgi:NAD(P)H-hydrate epimerase